MSNGNDGNDKDMVDSNTIPITYEEWHDYHPQFEAGLNGQMWYGNEELGDDKKAAICNETEVPQSMDGLNDGSTRESGVGPISIDYTAEFTTDIVFNTKDEMVEWIRSTGKKNGLVIVITSAETSGKKRTPRMRFGCDKGGTYRKFVKKTEYPVKRRPEHTGSKKCGCPFQLRCLQEAGGWTVTVFNGTHNHVKASNLEGHSYAGRLTGEETSILVDLSKALLKPRDILATLKHRDESNVTRIKTIYNARHRHRVNDQAGRSQMQQLLSKLAEHKYIEWHTSNEATGCVSMMFWAHPVGGDLLRAFPRVLIMDCTYKTNRYKYPLLEIVGLTSTAKTFSVAFAFMDYEKEENYAWILQRLKSMMVENVYPDVIVSDRDLALMNAIARTFPDAKHLLCRWHIGKNVQAKCKKMFDENTWEDFNLNWMGLVKSPNISTYEERLKVLERDYKDFPAAITYVKSSWLNEYKERFVSAWTDACLHFGNLTSNRAEGAHSKLKKYLQSSQGTFEAAWEKMHSLVELQWTEIKASFEISLGSVRHSFRPTLFRELRGFVSTTAMTHVLTESRRVQYIQQSDKPCECAIRRTHGIPCAHDIAPLLISSSPVLLSSIHDHWKKLDILPLPDNPSLETTLKADVAILFTKFPTMDATTKTNVVSKVKELVHPWYTPMVEPEMKAKARGRPKNAKGSTSTKRDPSEFEHVEAELKKMKLEKQKVRRKSYQAAKNDVRDLPFITEFPEGIRKYISNIKDVNSDGNCGFRAVGELVGYGIDDWVRVRRELRNELMANMDYYSSILLEHGRGQALLDALTFFNPHRHAPKANWMTMPDMGHVIATCYSVVLVFLSRQQCLTFLPLRSPSVAPFARKTIAIGFVCDCHFVEVTLLPKSPMPPIAYTWFAHRLECAKGWDTPYSEQIEAFASTVSNSSTTRETVLEV